jgi:hypothetical protein
MEDGSEVEIEQGVVETEQGVVETEQGVVETRGCRLISSRPGLQ